MNRKKLIFGLVTVLVLAIACTALFLASSGFMEMIQRHMGG